LGIFDVACVSVLAVKVSAVGRFYLIVVDLLVGYVFDDFRLGCDFGWYFDDPAMYIGYVLHMFPDFGRYVISLIGRKI
jgi:hypothetical protein